MMDDELQKQVDDAVRRMEQRAQPIEISVMSGLDAHTIAKNDVRAINQEGWEARIGYGNSSSEINGEEIDEYHYTVEIKDRSGEWFVVTVYMWTECAGFSGLKPACLRVVSIVEAEEVIDQLERFFARMGYGTMKGTRHAESGEEQLSLLVVDKDNEVWTEMLRFTRPS